MTKVLLILTTVFLVACGDNNKSSDKKDAAPAIITSPVLAMANDFGDNTLLKDNFRLFRIELTKDFNFILLRKRGRQLEQILSSRWSVNGVNFNLDQVGQGQYREIDIQGNRYACLFIRPETVSNIIKESMVDARIIDDAPQLKFCKILQTRNTL